MKELVDTGNYGDLVWFSFFTLLIVVFPKLFISGVLQPA
jgi:hypothetical protein